MLLCTQDTTRLVTLSNQSVFWFAYPFMFQVLMQVCVLGTYHIAAALVLAASLMRMHLCPARVMCWLPVNSPLFLNVANVCSPGMP